MHRTCSTSCLMIPLLLTGCNWMISLVNLTRSWPALEIEPLSNEEVAEFMQMTCLKADSFLSEELERQILKSCQVVGDVHPLYLTILVSSLLSNLSWREEEVRNCLNCFTSVQLYQFLVQDILGQCGQAAHLIKKVKSCPVVYL